jgi:hypothetical protein
LNMRESKPLWPVSTPVSLQYRQTEQRITGKIQGSPSHSIFLLAHSYESKGPIDRISFGNGTSQILCNLLQRIESDAAWPVIETQMWCRALKYKAENCILDR